MMSDLVLQALVVFLLAERGYAAGRYLRRRWQRYLEGTPSAIAAARDKRRTYRQHLAERQRELNERHSARRAAAAKSSAGRS
jgi:type IV secretory pathway VirD2 relaxase